MFAMSGAGACACAIPTDAKATTDATHRSLVRMVRAAREALEMGT
jgi:hypothetical protein